MIGQAISHYKILEKLGEGGMGVVYKAEDTKLDRTVALKFLPAQLNTSEQDKARFLQEAKAAAALNHPNVCSVMDIQEHDGQIFIVMEFVDGQTLREKEGTFTFKQAIDIGTQIADGLAAAHEKGIVHRDIKPENIMIRKDGIVQIMDFGLAKLRDAESKINRLTKEGSTVGTAGYMSPEQVQGQEVDHRSDIFSCGVVLYELFTGQLPFKGIHETAVAYEIVNVDAAPMSSIKPEIDSGLDAIVLECLEKDVNERMQSVKQVSIDLKRFRRESSKQRLSHITASRSIPKTASAEPKEAVTKIYRSKPWMWLTIFFFVTTLSSILYIYYLSDTPGQKQVIRASISLPEKSSLSNERGGGHIALSPDGEKFAFVAVDSSGKNNLWLQSLNALSAQMLSGTETAQFPFWSPDGKTIGFFADGKLKKIDAAGGTPFTICDAADPRVGTWNQTGVIVFGIGSTGALYQVSSAGGSPSAVTKLDSARNEQTHRWPYFLPDGKHFLFFIRTTAAGSGSGKDSICVGSIESREIKHLFNGASDAVYAQGYLLFIRESALMAQAFDLKKLEVSGEPVPIVQQIQYDARFSKATFSVSQNGLLMYESSGTRWKRELALFDSSGEKLVSFGQPEIFLRSRLSNDGKRIAMEIVDLQSHNIDLWLYEIERGIQTRFTFDSAPDMAPLWSPNCDRIVFSSKRKNNLDLYIKTTTGSVPEELLSDFDGRDKLADDWSSDGNYILFETSNDPKTKSDLMILPMTGDRKPFSFLQTEFNEQGGAFSPDMHWVAYTSNESGKDEVYVRPFSEQDSQQALASSGKWQISVNGGLKPRWRTDGKAIFYGAENKIMMAEIRANGSNFEVLRVTQHMDLKAKRQIATSDMSSDGKRILGSIIPFQEKSTPLTLVVNWAEELKKK
ncbi:MAG: serine/threonine-protein kinase [Ignavibacteriales bacterium]|nr:serine/threonine-protein kinase [Ignavibacteriales bacterium]